MDLLNNIIVQICRFIKTQLHSFLDQNWFFSTLSSD